MEGMNLRSYCWGVRIKLLPPRSTAKYQPLDLGLIAHSKIRYRSILLRITILVMLRRHAEDSDLPTSSKQGMLGLHDGFLPTVGDAMELLDESWSHTPRSTLIKCWIKSECLPDSHVLQSTEIIRDITSTPFSSQDLISDPISASEAEHIANDLNLIQSLDTPATPLSKILAEMDVDSNATSLMNILNSPAPFDVEPSRVEVADSTIQDLFNLDQDHQNSLSTENPSSGDFSGTILVQHLTESVPNHKTLIARKK